MTFIIFLRNSCKIFNELVAVLGENGFRVELNAVDRVRFMLHGHDDVFVVLGGGDVELAIFGKLGDEGVVAPDFGGVWDALEESGFSVMNEAGFAVNRCVGLDGLSAIGFADSLVA